MASGIKFNRNYELLVQTTDGATLTIKLPFTIEIDITKNTLTSANVCQVRIYNLAPETRNRIRFNLSNYGTYRQIQLRAGYGDSLALIFSGNISQAWSAREGVNFITQIECYDGGFAFNNGMTNTPVIGRVPYSTLFRTFMQDLPGISVGAIGDYSELTPRGAPYSGHPIDLLNQNAGKGAFFIDNEKANVLRQNEYISNISGTSLINASTGLLGTPMLEETKVHFDIVFEPYLSIAQKVRLEGLGDKNFDGDYKVTGIKHRGMISPTTAGTLITTAEFFYTKLLEPVESQSG